MTIRLELKPEVESALAIQAKAKGVPLTVYLQAVIEDLAHAPVAREPRLEEFRAALDKLARMGEHLPRVPSSAFSRESIYRDND